MFAVMADQQQQVSYSSLKFSGGEIQVRLIAPPHNAYFTHITITSRITQADQILELLLLTDALRREYPGLPIHSKCPYLPYARQDRVCAPGEALSLRVMCDLINRANFASVEVWDVHSDVALALLNNVRNIEPQYLIQSIGENAVLVAPDAGAAKRVHKVAQLFKRPVVQAEKIRSVVDGAITGVKVHSDSIGDKDFFIVDDICDGGRTFVELAKELRPLTRGKILLYVTHGIFSQGLQPFEGLIDHIWVANPFPGVDLNNPILSQIYGGQPSA